MVLTDAVRPGRRLRRARILPFHPPCHRRGPDRVDDDGFIIDDEGPDLVTCAFGRQSVELEMDFEEGSQPPSRFRQQTSSEKSSGSATRAWGRRSVHVRPLRVAVTAGTVGRGCMG